VEPGWTTISCRFIALRGVRRTLVPACLLLASLASVQSVALGQNAAPSLFLPLVPRWSMELSAPPAAPPIIAGDTVVIALQAGGVIAFDLQTGKTKWRAEVSAERGIGVDGDRAVIASRDALYGLQLGSGEQAWRADTGMLTAPPLAHGGWALAATPGSVTAFRASDGSIVWTRSVGPIENRPAIDGDVLFLPILEGSIVALNLQTGEDRWETPLGGAPGEPLAAAGRVYVTASDKTLYTIDAGDGEIKWVKRVGAAPRGRAALDDDRLYFVALDNVLRGLHRGHGAQLWTKGLPYRPSAGPLFIGSGLLVPGAVTTLPVLDRKGNALTELRYSSTLAGVSNVTTGAWDYPVVAVVTGDLQNPWTIQLLETSTDPPVIPIAPPTALPGETIPIALPQ
jgi:outer membrane protein assembly factor BamB